MSFVAKHLFSGPGSHIVFHDYVSNLVFKNLRQLLSLSFHDLATLLMYGMSLHLGMSCDVSCLVIVHFWQEDDRSDGSVPSLKHRETHDASRALVLLIPDDADLISP